MTTLKTLLLILAILVILVGGKNGFKAIISFGLNFCLLFLSVILIAGGFSPIMISVLSGGCILAITIYLSDCQETVANTAFFATVIVLALMVIMIIPFDHLVQIEGFSSEDSEEVEAFNLAIGINFESLLIATTILSTLGAIAEAAIAITSGMQEIIEQTPAISSQNLRKSGRTIGFQIMGMTFNTLFFGMFGGNLALFILLDKLRSTFGYYLNSKIFVGETFMVLYSAIAVIGVIGVAIELMVRKVENQQVKQD